MARLFFSTCAFCFYHSVFVLRNAGTDKVTAVNLRSRRQAIFLDFVRVKQEEVVEQKDRKPQKATQAERAATADVSTAVGQLSGH